ncbi:MAG: tryptophan synthase subunit alpha [Deltaproteobacteria bacterium]|nr:MAG: tryptophan synthase subunit alpha [Deltaproteobacteria bacterium]
MSRFSDLIPTVRAQGRGAFVPFVVLGDPDLATSVALARALCEAGSDALELGFPFSDPPADGPVIQAADVRALQAGTTPPACFEAIESIRGFTQVPISLLVYYNLVLRFGIDAFYARAAEVGVDAVLIADLPPEHAGEILTAAEAHGVDPVFLASELSTPVRLRRIAEVCRGYVYCLARVGVTGTRNDLGAAVGESLARFREAFDLPLLLGFGISSPAHVRAALASGADGVIVGSAIVRQIEAHLQDPDAMRRAVHDTARALREATSLPPTQSEPC